jgi:hypothetical protein
MATSPNTSTCPGCGAQTDLSSSDRRLGAARRRPDYVFKKIGINRTKSMLLPRSIVKKVPV